MRSARRHAGIAVVVAALTVALAACAHLPGREPPPQVPNGNPADGAVYLARFGCGSCHEIPGIRGADGLVGPPLIHWSRRGFIAGELPNGADTLIRWIMDPREVEPGTDMPDLNVTEAQARDIAAYLFTLK